VLTALTFAVALVVGLAATPVVRLMAIDRGFLDHPDPRKVHTSPIPRVGGVAMILAFGLAIGAAAFVAPDFRSAGELEPNRVPAILAGVALLAVVGIIDDLNGMRARVKLVAQMGAATLAWLLGLRIELLQFPWGTIDVGVLSLPLTVVWIVAVINAVNLIDGLDGLASGVALTVLGAFVVVAAGDGVDSALIVSAACAGAAVGFLAYNLHPAEIIMGDTGSMFLGFVVAAVAISITQDGLNPASPWVPIVALAVPIADTLFAIVRRKARGGSVFEADMGHIHHQLLNLGMGQRDAMLLLTAVSAAFGVLAILLARLD
jgi:UDP-GlcNAc:undecaprenyl-phosphate/decaprenyl-phosphate GlcNAc-1-phosphate transferase